MAMAQPAIGKLLPNLKVTIDEASRSLDESKSEEVVFEDEEADDRDVEVVRSWMKTLQNPKIYKNKSGAFVTGLDVLSEENAEKLDKRAERFNIEKEYISVAESISSLYESMGIESRNSAKLKNIRLNALHMRGVNDLDTKDIFRYFQDYGPDSVEWINDFSCNVVWLDETTCARALLGTSKPQTSALPKKQSITTDDNNSSEKPDSKESTEESMQEDGELMDTEDEPAVDIPVPPGIWRVGNPYPKAKSILLRFATKEDKKLPGAEKRSTFYQKYGNPNYGGLTGIISASRKRKMLAAANRSVIESSKHSNFEEELPDDPPKPKSKVPRMRMYADDEEIKQIKTRLRNQNSSITKASVHSRLGTKYTQDDLCRLGADVSRQCQRNARVEVDLRRKITKLKAESEVNKHRSPLCKDD